MKILIYNVTRKRNVMEFNVKLQELRKQKKLTQEELAQALFVSRTAVSKWESGRGYPNIESLKAIAGFFGVTVDELLSGEEVMTIAEEDNKQKISRMCDLVFGLLDISVILFLFLPIFGQKSGGNITAVSLLSLTEIAPYVKAVYFAVIILIVLSGIITLALQNFNGRLWLQIKNKISLILNALGVLLFILSPQPYAAAILFAFLLIKVAVTVKKK